MLECIFNNGNKGLMLPSNLGPGPKKLLGSYTDPITNKSTGFFGETTDLYTTTELLAAISEKTAAIINATILAEVVWLKFLLDDKIVYVAKTPIFHKLSYNNLLSGSLLFAPGRTLNPRSGYTYQCRTLQWITVPNNTVVPGFPNDMPASHGSEWNRLMYNIVTNINPLSQQGDKWAEYVTGDIQVTQTGGGAINEIGPGTIVYSTPATSYHLARATIDVIGGNSNFNTATDRRQWRPCLVLV